MAKKVNENEEAKINAAYAKKISEGMKKAETKKKVKKNK